MIKKKKTAVNNILLKDTDNRGVFLSKVGLIMVIYSGICLMIAHYIQAHVEDTRETYIHTKLKITFNFYFFFFIFIKIIFSIFGSLIRSLAELFFIIDIYFTFMTIMGIYFSLASSYTNYYD